MGVRGKDGVVNIQTNEGQLAVIEDIVEDTSDSKALEETIWKVSLTHYTENTLLCNLFFLKFISDIDLIFVW